MKRLLFCALLAVILVLGGATVPRLQQEGVASALDTSGIAWLQSLPLDEWQRIDNGDQGIERVRWLFDSIINQARIQMALEADGGAFELVLRKYIFYFHPEYEYWFPPYPDFDEGLGNPIEEKIDKQVRWPVKVMREIITYPSGKQANQITIKLGRQYDDEREIKILFRSDDKYKIKSIMLNHDKYLPGVEGPPKREELLIKFNKEGNHAKFLRAYWGVFSRDEDGNPQWDPDELYSYEKLMEFGDGDPDPVDGNVDGDGSINGEPALDISGVEHMFDSLVVDDWHPFARDRSFWVFRSLINLCKLQFGLTENGGEFEEYLRKDFFYYYPWEPWYESVDVFREPSGPTTAKYRDEFKFDTGAPRTHQRDIFVKFVNQKFVRSCKAKHPIFDDWYWGISDIILERYLKDSGNPPKTEQLMFTFDFFNCYKTAKYIYTILNPDGTIYSQETKIFRYGNPNPLD